MSTGQFPRRRESDKAAQRRVEGIERRRKEHLKLGRAMNEFESALSRANRPRISGSGRLIRQW